MSLRQISATLNLDTGQFTVAVKEASGETRTLKRDMEDLGRTAKSTASSLDGSSRSVKSYSETTLKLSESQRAVVASQNELITSLQKEYEALVESTRGSKSFGDTHTQLVAVEKALGTAIEQKNKFLKDAALAEELATKAAREAGREAQAREDTGKRLLQNLRDQILVLKEGSDALLIEKARISGVEAETRKLIEIKNEEIEVQKRLNAERNKPLTASQQLEKELRGQITALREQAVFAKGGAAALAEYRASVVGATETMGPLIAELRAAEIEFERTAKSAHLSGRAIYEMNVLTHELSSGRIRQAISSFSILLSQIGLAGEAVLGLTLTIGVLYGLSKPIEEAAKHMEELKKQSQELGVSTNFLQTLGTASELTGTKTDKLVAGIGRLDQAFARAKGGSKQTQQAFEQLGISIKDNFTNEQLTQKLIEGWAKVADGPAKAALATRLFGRSGLELIPVLNTLSGNWDEINKKTAEYGLNNEKAVQVGAKLAEHFHEAALAARGLGMAFLEAIGPSLISMIDGFRKVSSAITSFIGDGDKLRRMIDDVKVAAIGLATFFATRFTFAATIAAVMTLRQAFFALELSMALSGKTLTLLTAFQALGAFMVRLATATIPTLMASMESLWAVVAANPITAVAAAVALLTTGIIYLENKNREAAEASLHLRDAQELLLKSQDLLNEATNKSISMTKEMIRQTTADTNEQLKNAEATLVAAKAKIALAEANIRANAPQFGDIGPNGAPGLDSDGKKANARSRAFEQIDAGKKVVDQAQQSVDKLHAALDALAARKPVGSEGGTGDIPLGGSTAKTNAALEAISSLRSQLGGLMGDIDDSGATFGKYKALLDDSTSSLSKAVGGNKALRDEILRLAESIDKAKPYGKLKNEADEQHARLTDLRDEYAKVVSGVKEATIAQDRYNAKLRELSVAAKGFTPKGQQTPKDLENSARTDSAESGSIERAMNSMRALSQKQDEFSASGAELWAQYNAGLMNADVGLARLKASLDKYVAAQTEEGRVAAENARDQIVQQYKQNESISALIKMRDETKSINRDLMTDSVQKARATAEAQIEAMRQVVFYAGQSVEERKRAEAEFADFVKAKNEQMRANSKFGQLARDWGNVTDNMKSAGTRWLDQFATDLAQGKLNFKSFAASVIADLAEIVAKALIAKYVIEPLLNAFGVPSAGGSGGSFGGTTGYSMSNPVPTTQLHDGGIGAEGTHRMADARWFINAPKFHQGRIPNLQSHEMAAIIRKDEGVFTPEQMKAMGARMSGGSKEAPKVEINLKNESGTALDADHSGSRFDGEQYIVDVVVSKLNRPGTLRNSVRNVR